MKRIIKYPLFMRDDKPVRNLEDFHEYFDAEKMTEYFLRGKLSLWLRNHYYDEMADEVEALSSDDKELLKKLCDIMEVSADLSEINVDTANVLDDVRKKHSVEKITDDKYIHERWKQVAFTQNEFDELLKRSDISEIFLFGEKFSLCSDDVIFRGTVKGISEKTELDINGIIVAELKDKGIFFKNVTFINRNKIELATDNEDIHRKWRQAAYTQKDFEKLLESKKYSDIYLCGEKFSVPAGFEFKGTLHGIGEKKVQLDIGAMGVCAELNNDVLSENIEFFNSILIKTGNTFVLGKHQDIPVEWVIYKISDEEVYAISKYVLENIELLKYYQIFERTPIVEFEKNELKCISKVKWHIDLEHISDLEKLDLNKATLSPYSLNYDENIYVPYLVSNAWFRGKNTLYVDVIDNYGNMVNNGFEHYWLHNSSSCGFRPVIVLKKEV